MRRNLLVLAVALVSLAGLAHSATAFADPPIPQPVGYVNDFAGVFTLDVEAPLEEALRLFEQETTVELVVVTVKDMGGAPIEDYSARLFEDWGIGKKGEDNGVLLILATSEPGVRIEVGYGMEPYLTDGMAGNILDTEVIPDLQQGNYALGLLKGARAIAQTIKDSDYQPGSGGSKPPIDRFPLPFQGGARLWLLIGMGMASLYLVSFMARSKSIWLGGIWGGIVGGVLGWMTGSVLFAILLVIGLAVIGLLLDALLSKGYASQQTSGSSTRWHRSWGGFQGSIGGGWSSGKTFGGFGGGRSGGGGASRRF